MFLVVYDNLTMICQSVLILIFCNEFIIFTFKLNAIIKLENLKGI